MTSNIFSFLEILQALKTVVKYSGISGLWMGLTSTLLRDVPFSAIYWLNYETIKQKFQTQQTFTFNFIAGAVAGSVSVYINLTKESNIDALCVDFIGSCIFNHTI